MSTTRRLPGLRMLVAGLFAGLFAVGVTACGGGGSNDARWPDVRVSALDGTETTSATLRTSGRPVIVTIWATSCAPCREELPRLQTLATGTPGIDVVAVNLGDRVRDITAFMTSLDLTLPTYVDDEGRLTEALGVASVPATVFVDAGGTIVERHLGALSAADLAAGAEMLLAGD